MPAPIRAFWKQLGIRLASPVRPYTAMHLALSGVLGGWSFVLAMPVSTFEGSKSYDLFAAITPDERVWSVFFGCFALLGLVGAISRRDNIRWWSALALGSVHLMVALFLFSANPVNTGTFTYCTIAAQAYYLLRKLVAFRGDG